MNSTEGIVKTLDGRYALVEPIAGGCGRCHEEGGCGGNNLGKMLCRTPSTFRVLNPVGAEVGDRVSVTVADGVIGRGATLAYALPLVLAIAGAMIASAAADEGAKNLMAIGGSVGGLMAAWAYLAWRRTRSARPNEFQPYIESRSVRG